MIGQSLKKGFARLSQLPLLLSCFFLYQLMWGVLLYLVVKSVFVPILFRMPNADAAPELFHFFLIESQIRFIKTDTYVPMLILAFTLIALRLIITPFLNAGLYYAIRHREEAQPQLHLFIEGVRRHSLSFLFIHLFQWIFMVLPFVLYFSAAGTVGKEYILQFTASVVQSENKTLLFAIITGACLYFALIRLVTMYICFSRFETESVLGAVAKWGRHALPTILIAVGMFIVYTLIFSMLSTLTLNAAGFTALLIYFAGYSARLLFKCWEVSTLQQYYKTGT